MKKALYNANLDYIIPYPARNNNIQNLSINNDLCSDHSAILFNFSTNINKSVSRPIKVKLYHEANWDSINSSLSKQLAILQDKISLLITDDNPDPINIINHAVTIRTDTIKIIHNQLPEKSVKPNTSIPLFARYLILQKIKIKRVFIKSRSPFLKSALNAISQRIKKLIKSHCNADIQKRIQNFQLSKELQS